MEHTLEVEEREVGMLYLDSVRVHICPTPDATTENIRAARTGWAGEDEEASEEAPGVDLQDRSHVVVAAKAVFQLSSAAKLNYYLTGPPRYDMSVSDVQCLRSLLDIV